MKERRNRLLVERPLTDTECARPPREGRRARNRAVRSVTVNLAESPLGWLKARGHVSVRQFEAGERLRDDWERAQYGPGVTMRWDAAPLAGGRRAAPAETGASESQIAARRRFEEAVAAAGGGLSDVLWRVVCAGEGMREVETALGWPARAGKLVLTLALDRLADFYRVR
ncbi:MAG TPA: DUF6456 domain-containing protein [Allosphingosinicella sp.]|jgi:hypothetical protein